MSQTFDIQAPVIATGRGGSGTRLLSTLLVNFGVFLGNELNPSGDGLEWANTTREMLNAGISIERGTFDDSWRARLVKHAQSILSKADGESHKLWGWKLPELMHLYPEFLRAFPRARLIVLVRHPVNLCLRRTHVSSRLGNPVGDVVLPAAYRFLGLEPDDIENQPDHINNAVSWEFQMRKFVDSDCINTLPPEQLLILRYEDLALSSSTAQQELYEFLYGECQATAQIQIELEIDANRINKIDVGDERVGQVWDVCGDTATRLGYSREGFLSA